MAIHTISGRQIGEYIEANIRLSAVLDLTETEAHDLFCKARWQSTSGHPVCPTCKTTGGYFIKKRRKFSCVSPACRKQFSVTTGTEFASRKLTFVDLVYTIKRLCQARRDLPVYKDTDHVVTTKTAYRVARSLNFVRSKFTNNPLSNCYPFVRTTSQASQDGAFLLIEVSRAISHGLPEHARQDICQEIVFDILCGTLGLGDLKTYADKYVRKYFSLYANKFKFVSLDAPIFDDSARTLIDTIPSDAFHF